MFGLCRPRQRKPHQRSHICTPTAIKHIQYTDLGTGLGEGVAVDADVRKGPAVEVLGHIVQARHEAVDEALNSVVLRLAGLLDERLFCLLCWAEGGELRVADGARTHRRP